MKLAIVLSTQPASFSALAYKGELEINLKKIADLGFDGVELAVRDPNLLDVPNLQHLVSSQGLEVAAIGTGQAYGEEGLSFTSQESAVREQAIERIKAQIDLAAEFNALVIIGLLRGKLERRVAVTQAEDWLVEALIVCSRAASAKNVLLALEPINRYETDLINTVDAGLKLVDRVGVDSFGLLLDTFHMNIEEASIEESIRRAGDRIYHFHVADSNRWYPGAGHVDFRKVIDVLAEVGYKGYLSAEILPLPDADSCARETMAFLAPLVS